MTIGEVGLQAINSAVFTAGDYIALIKTDDSEVSGGGYARQVCHFQRSTEQGLTNQFHCPALDWGVTTAAWGTVNKFRVYRNASATGTSNVVYEGNLTQQTINQSVAVTASAGAIAITLCDYTQSI